ncbi:MAG: hypothetical protein EOS18_06140 [Mesorhizobium sp.]|nr:MAG: hypothetical protein EOS18_06140 [Mesorhizobium sp.]
MSYIGDFPEDFTTVAIMFTTHAASGAPVAPSSGFEAADVKIYKNGSAAEKTSTNGLTMTSPFDSITGLHCLVIDTSNDTDDVGFWVAGAQYTVVLSPDETVDSLAVAKVIGTFGLALAPVFARVGAPAGASVSADVAAVKAVLPAALVSGRIDASVGAMAANVMTAAAAAADLTTELQSGLATAASIAALNNLSAAQVNAEVDTAIADAALATAANLATVDAVVDAIKVTTDKLDDTVEDDVGTFRFTANALEQAPTGGSAPTAVEVANEVQTRTIAAVTTVNGLAANSVSAAALAADAVTEIQAGLATQASVDDLPTNAELATALATADDAVLAQVALVRAKTDNLPDDPADQSLIVAATDAVMSRLGAPAGASLSADIAAVKTDTAAVKSQTDSLTFTVAGKVNANVTHVNETAVTGSGETGDEWGPA